MEVGFSWFFIVPGWFFMVCHDISWFQVDFYSFSRFQVRFYGFLRLIFIVFHGSRLFFHGFWQLQVGSNVFHGYRLVWRWTWIPVPSHPLLSMKWRISTRMVRRISMRMERNAKPGCRRTVSWASATLCGNPPPWPSPTASPASTYLSNLPFFPTIFSSLGFVWPLFFFSTSRFLVNHLAPAPLWSFVTIKPRPLS